MLPSADVQSSAAHSLHSILRYPWWQTGEVAARTTASEQAWELSVHLVRTCSSLSQGSSEFNKGQATRAVMQHWRAAGLTSARAGRAVSSCFLQSTPRRRAGLVRLPRGWLCLCKQRPRCGSQRRQKDSWSLKFTGRPPTHALTQGNLSHGPCLAHAANGVSMSALRYLQFAH